ncbi:MAG: UvrD-helicase domain-containing protein [bacterium]
MSAGTTGTGTPLVDAEARARIRASLGETLVVEAAAGTGKTTELVRRIVAVLAQGRAKVDSIVAVTFTEKAAGELKLRLRGELEVARRRAADKDDPVRRNLEAALARLEEARVSTIHGFCADLLRERSVEACVDPRFEVLKDPESARAFAEAFDLWLQEQLESPPEGVRRSLRRTSKGPEDEGPIARLRGAGLTLVEWRDFPAPWRRDAFDRDAGIDAAVKELHAFADLTERCSDKQRDSFYRDTERARAASREIRAAEAVRDRDADGVEAALVALNDWRFRHPGKGRGKKFGEDLDRDVVRAAHERLCDTLTRFQEAADADLAALLHAELAEAVKRYEALKARSGRLDFLDLLRKTRDLLKERDDVRAEFHGRFSHLFVDEFQDTDPLQAEILLLLAADDPRVSDWRKVTPAPGRLFLVADPKQSIYRFRRADVGTYLEVRDQVVLRGGSLLHLTTSFRSAPAIQRVVNASFAPLIVEDADAQQPGYVPLAEHRAPMEGQPAVVALPVPSPYGARGGYAKNAISRSLPDATGAFVAWLIQESGWQVTEKDETNPAQQKRVPVQARHVCLLFRRLQSFGDDVSRLYVEALEARGVRHLLVGGRSFHEREEVESIRTALAAIEWPDDELSVFATLRGPFFAVGDEALLEWRHRFKRLHPFRVPEEAAAGEAAARLAPIREALALLAALHRGRNRRPVADTVNLLLETTRAHAGLVLRPSGEQALANVLHVAEQARDYEATGGISFRGFVERLMEEAGARQAAEAPILEEGSDGVRIMTVHKAKGLEFPVVILADMTASVARDQPQRALDPEKGLCAVRIAGWAPAELLEARDAEIRRDVAEGVRLAYVAATRARDLLVVPALGDGPWMDMEDGAKASWIAPLFGGIYPKVPERVEAEAAAGCPRFGKDSVRDRVEETGEASASCVRPGSHRFEGAGGEASAYDVVWWDPNVLDLGREPPFGVRSEELLSREVDASVVQADVAAYRAWEEQKRALVEGASRPSCRVETATERARRNIGGAGTSAGAGARGAPGAAGREAVERIDLPREKKRPSGRRFGTLVHAVLANVPLDADVEGLRVVAELSGRVLGAPEEEVAAAAKVARTVLQHPLLAKAREAAKRGDCRRETPLTWRDGEGALVEGVVDLAFREGDAWTVVDFKTDRELDGTVEVYREQVALYASIVAAATGDRARGVLMAV